MMFDDPVPNAKPKPFLLQVAFGGTGKIQVEPQSSLAG
jgi:hypothetical protein